MRKGVGPVLRGPEGSLARPPVVLRLPEGRQLPRERPGGRAGEAFGDPHPREAGARPARLARPLGHLVLLVPWGCRRRSCLKGSWCWRQGRVGGPKGRRSLGRFSPERLQRLSGIWASLTEEGKRSWRGNLGGALVWWEGDRAEHLPQRTSKGEALPLPTPGSFLTVFLISAICLLSETKDKASLVLSPS